MAILSRILLYTHTDKWNSKAFSKDSEKGFNLKTANTHGQAFLGKKPAASQENVPVLD